MFDLSFWKTKTNIRPYLQTALDGLGIFLYSKTVVQTASFRACVHSPCLSSYSNLQSCGLQRLVRTQMGA